MYINNIKFRISVDYTRDRFSNEADRKVVTDEYLSQYYQLFRQYKQNNEEGYIEIALKENGTKKMDKEASICSYFLSSSPDNANYASNLHVKFEMKNTNNIIDITKNQNYPVHIMKGNATVKIKNNVCIHSIVGTVKYEVDNNIFNVICLCSVTDSRVNLEGTYKGKETSMGKTWNTVYTITGSSDDYYIAEVKLQSGFNVITEERVLEVTDDNSVIVSRQDVLSGDILSFEPFITSIDYTEDALVGVLNLQR